MIKMKKYIKDFISVLETKIEKKYKFTEKEILLIHQKIQDFQHERLIHLLVTLFYAIFALFFLGLTNQHVLFIIPFLAMIIFLLFYIRHYFFLENAVQYIYKLYDKIIIK